jgi:hypothetical protein
MTSDPDPTAPTPGQLRAAANLGLIVPVDITKAGLWELIHEAQVRIETELEDAARKKREKHRVLVVSL